jgi:hypothetical protein
MFNKFSECTGLRVNFDKTEAIWLGSRRSCHEQLLPDKHLSWNFSGKIKLLGISFNLSESDKTLENFTEKVQSVKKILVMKSDIMYVIYFHQNLCFELLSNVCNYPLLVLTLFKPMELCVNYGRYISLA